MLDRIRQYDEVIESTSSIIKTLKIYPRVFEKEEHKYLHIFFDKNLYNALCLLDLIIGLKYLDISQAIGNQLEANYFARIVAHSSYEILDDLNKLLGKETRTYIIDKYEASYLTKVDMSVKSLNKIKKENSLKLKEIRHNLFGHKLGKGYIQAEMIIQIDNNEIYKIGKEINNIQHELLRNFVELLTRL